MSFVTRTQTRVALAALAVLAVVGASSGIAQNSPDDGATAAGTSLVCDQNTLYAITSDRDLLQINATTGATTTVAQLPTATNALAVTRQGTSAWAFQNSGNSIDIYDPVAGTSRTIANPDPDGSQSAIRGAIDPVSNIFYYAGSGTSPRLAAYNIGTGAAIGRVATLTGLGGSNGDMAFGTDGTLYVVDGDKVYRVGTVPTTAGNPNLAATEILTLPSGTSSPGIAYSADGFLFLAVSGQPTIYKINPSSGANVATITTSNNKVVDLATCNYSNSLRGLVDVRSRAAAGDQFTVVSGARESAASCSGSLC